MTSRYKQQEKMWTELSVSEDRMNSCYLRPNAS